MPLLPAIIASALALFMVRRSRARRNSYEKDLATRLGEAYLLGEDVTLHPRHLEVLRDLSPEVVKGYGTIPREVEVQFVDFDPYSGYSDMAARVLADSKLLVWSGGTASPFMDHEVNLRLRAWHDIKGHIVPGNDFSFEGEVGATVAAIRDLPAAFEPYIFSEVVAQAAAYWHLGKEFPPAQKVVIIDPALRRETINWFLSGRRRVSSPLRFEE